MERALRICREPSCSRLTRDTSGYCEEHKAVYEQREKEKESRYSKERNKINHQIYDARWKKLRLIKLRLSPLCEYCLENGIITPATLVDHIKDAKDYPELRYELSNLKSACDACHEKKHKGERWKRRGKEE